MNFWKMNGAGNDFIIINNIEEKIPAENFKEIAIRLCERHMSIGADGLMIVEKPDGDADYKMIFYNSDGSLGEMCGNGARCICRFGFENHLAGKTQRIETTAGIVTGERISERSYKIRLNTPAVCRLDEDVSINNVHLKCSYVELGNPGIPHCVTEIKNLQDFPEDMLRDIGRSLRRYSKYPKGANVNFYDIIGDNHIYERTFERGVEDFTYACGTGTGSVVMVLTLKKLVSGDQVKVDMKGGQLTVDVMTETNKVTDIFLTGPTNIVARGEVLDEELKYLINRVY